MKNYEILSLFRGTLERLHGFGIRFDDYRWVDLYRDYRQMRKDGDKKTYIVLRLSQKYNICERKVYEVIKKMEKDCNFGAV